MDDGAATMRAWMMGLVVAVVFWAGGITAARAEQPESLVVNGLERTYRIHVPTTLPSGKPAPLVLVFHGRATNGWMTSYLTKFSRLADQEKFIVVYPNGLHHNWNDGRPPEVSKSHRDKVDDEGFIKVLIEHVASRYAIDPRRVYAAGISNGALFAHYFAGRNPELVAAIACVAGNLPQPFDQSFDPKFPVAVLVINGTSDPIVPFQGGDISPGARGKVLSTHETIKRWITKNRCKPDARSFPIPDRDPADGCDPVGYQWPQGGFNSEVVFVKVHGGGHTWPGSIQYLPQIFIGKICRDFSATKMIWDFFQRHSKPE